MDQIEMKKAEDFDRCATASCNGTVKKLSLLGGCLKRCGLCDERKLFRRIVKCTECEIVYHRRCGNKSTAAGRVDGCERDVRPTALQHKAVGAADESANADATHLVHGGRDPLVAYSAIVNNSTTMVPTLRPLPPVRVTMFSALEYFQCLLAAKTERRETTLSLGPRPVGPTSSRLTRADLIKESRLTTLQRNTLWLRSGDRTTPSTAAPAAHARKSAASSAKRYRPSSKRKTLKDIVESGAYEPEAYKPDTRPNNYNAEKEKLQSIMAFGRVRKLDPVALNKRHAVQKKSKECTEEELIDSVISEIEDREKFLTNMELLGQRSKYSGYITHEICDRIKKLEVFVDKTPGSYRKTDVRDIASKYQKPFGSRKTTWITENPTSIDHQN